LERQIGARLIDQGIENLLRIIEATGCRVIMDHHALRDPGHGERLRRLWDTKRVVTAAGYLGLADKPLEAWRHALWRRRRKPEARAERPRLKRATPSDIVERQAIPQRAKGGKRR